MACVPAEPRTVLLRSEPTKVASITPRIAARNEAGEEWLQQKAGEKTLGSNSGPVFMPNPVCTFIH